MHDEVGWDISTVDSTMSLGLRLFMLYCSLRIRKPEYGQYMPHKISRQLVVF